MNKLRTNEAYWSESQQRWQINVQKDGIRKTFVSSKALSDPNNRKGKLEAERKADKFLAADKPLTKAPRISALLEEHYNILKETTGYDSARKEYNHYFNYIEPEIGNLRISAITEADLQQIINNAYIKRKLAEKSLGNLRYSITHFIKYCRIRGYTSLFPESLTIPKGAAPNSRQIIETDIVKYIFENDKSTYFGKVVTDHYIHAYRFAIAEGLRPGELLGLKWSDIKGETIHITRSLNNNNKFTRGKNDNARRSFIPCKRSQEELKQQKQMLKEKGIETEYVFAADNGGFTSQEKYREAFGRYCDYNKIPYRKPYEMRHTFVSMNDDMPAGLKRQRMGHSVNMDTEGHYGHQKKGDMERIAAYAESALDRTLNPVN